MVKGKPIKISVIGVGHVGSVVGFILARRGLANEIVLCARDGNDEKERDSQRRAEMAALDIKHAISFTSHRLEVRAGTTEDTANSDILIMAASEKISKEITTRKDPAWAVGNAKLVHQLVPRLAKLSPGAIFVNVTNPLDAVTYHIYKASGFEWRKVIGTGTLIDTARFRRRLSDEMDINAMDLRAYIIGEHGETQFAMLGNATVGGMPLNRLGENRRQKIAAAEEEAKNIGIQIFGVLGHTTYAVAMAVEMIVENIVNDLSSVLPVSVLIEGFCGVRDVCLSLPCVVADYGIRERLEPELNQDEKRRFLESAAEVRKTIGIGSPDTEESHAKTPKRQD
jgi:L-lactate dehydrogenase